MNSSDKLGINNLWHFGDSFGLWGTAPKGYSEYISDYYNLEFRQFVIAGASNEKIFGHLLSHFYTFKKGDYVLINWSYFNRMAYITDSLSLSSTACSIFKTYNEYRIDTENNNEEWRPFNSEYFEYLLRYKWEFSSLESIILFKYIIVPFLISLEKMGIVVINSFISYDVYHSDKLIPFNKSNIMEYNHKIKNVNFARLNPNYFLEGIKYIDWGDKDGSYNTFLFSKKWANEEDTHYTFGIQEELGKEWVDRIDKQILKK